MLRPLCPLPLCPVALCPREPLEDLPLLEDLETRNSSQDDLKEKLKQCLEKLEAKIGGRIENDTEGYMKALNIFEKQIDRLPDKTDAALQNALCTFGKVATEAISVIKRKKGIT